MLKSRTGGAVTMTTSVFLMLSWQLDVFTTNSTAYVPTWVYTCVGFRSVALLPSPKYQVLLTMGEPVDVDLSVNLTVSGEHPVATPTVPATPATSVMSKAGTGFG